MHPQHDRLSTVRCDKRADERDLAERQSHDVVDGQRNDLRARRGARGEDGRQRGDEL
jgi:hypothetical protein